MWSVIFSILALLISFYLFRPYFESRDTGKDVFKAVLIISSIAIVGALLIKFIFYKEQPESFKIGIDLLQHDKTLLAKIGDFNSYSFKTDSLPEETDNPAKFKVMMEGSDARIYLECTMQKDKTGKWLVKELKEDSLIRK